MIYALAITGVALVAIFAAWMSVLFVSMAFADNGYVGRHRGLPDSPPKRARRDRRTPYPPRSYHRTLGGRHPTTPDRRPRPREIDRSRQARMTA
ncbi:hypothetical protein [Actinomadura sp. NTSP31]|uniref:hypothetical protein n=1 Tax=Actinomadura sp. NTSP31 TaxID=1735447 RepID=UPI0035C20D9B